MKTMKMTLPSIHKLGNSDDGGTEGAHRATVVPPSSEQIRRPSPSPPDPEVRQGRPRRKFTAKYKLQILQEVDTCTQPGQIGTLLRREGLYYSNLTLWRKQKKQGLLLAMAPKKRGRKPKTKNPLSEQVDQLDKENRRLRQKLQQAETIIEVQKKISELLGISQKPNEKSNS